MITKRDTRTRTIVKIVAWQSIAILITFCILVIFIGDVNKALTIGLIDHSICMTVHYFYERIWNNFSCCMTETAVLEIEKEVENVENTINKEN
jgi:uncharacterized membrane protein